jgi:hypothetical protein
MDELNNQAGQDGGVDPVVTEPLGQQESIQSEPSVSADAWINDLWETPVVQDKGNQPQPQDGKPKEQGKGQTQGQDGGKPIDGKGNQPQPEKVDPHKIFAEAPGKAFFNDKGELDNSKINDFIFSDGKSLLNFGPQTPLDVVETKKEEITDPDVEYHKTIAGLTESLSGEIERLRGLGVTDSDILARILGYTESASGKRAQAKVMQAAVEQQKKVFTSEFQEIREAKIQARIDRNNSELSAKVEGFITGLDGMQTLTQFLLNNNAGGPLLDKLFVSAHPEALKMAPEKRMEVIKPWFRQFQQDKEMLAFVAEYGMLKTLKGSMKSIIEYAQSHGAKRAVNAAEAARAGVSSIKSPPPSSKGNSFFDGLESIL